ncbi:hypothetical protein LAWI1_G007547 [Lachnellula willkommii]|uniref:Uncharacterized protein n=1 Tax=Lachnellula willkommii TaxID=215461 RepID=A0A559M578_9HELO|nr:hypothetical protein LAWI1_G007547 [Lachnellula willkommii]
MYFVAKTAKIDLSINLNRTALATQLFRQNRELNAILVGTGDKIIVERVSPSDRIWGIRSRSMLSTLW